MIVCPSSLHSCVQGTNSPPPPSEPPGEIMSFGVSPVNYSDSDSDLKVLFKEMQFVAFFIFHMGKTRMQVKNDLRCLRQINYIYDVMFTYLCLPMLILNAGQRPLCSAPHQTVLRQVSYFQSPGLPHMGCILCLGCTSSDGQPTACQDDFRRR